MVLMVLSLHRLLTSSTLSCQTSEPDAPAMPSHSHEPSISSASALSSQEPPVPAHKWSILGLEAKKLVFFKYEKRIRDKSPLEKVGRGGV